MSDFETFKKEFAMACNCWEGHEDSKALSVECRRRLMTLSKLCITLRKEILINQKVKEAERKAKKVTAQAGAIPKKRAAKKSQAASPDTPAPTEIPAVTPVPTPAK